MPQPRSREQARLERKKAIAEQQASQFEDELSAHELNIARLEAIPEDNRDDDWQVAHDAATRAIETLRQAIETTLAEAQ